MKKSYGLLLALVLIFWTVIYFILPSPVEVIRKKASAILTSDMVGVNVDSSSFSFGYIPLKNKGSSTRSFTLINTHSFPVKVEIKIKGNITPFIYVSSNHFVLLPHQNRTLNLTFVYRKAHLANARFPILYTGEVIIEFFKAGVFNRP